MPANFRRTCLLLLAFLHTPFPLASFGQQTAASSSGIVQLTLKQAVQLALHQNPQRVIARLLVFESDRNSQIARSPLLPQANIEAGADHSISTTFRDRARAAARRRRSLSGIQAGPAFSQTIFNLPLIRGYQIGREGTRQSRADELTTRETVVTAVVDQYLLILRALATRDAANARVALAQRLYEQATELQKTGIGLNIDTVRANVELQNERQNLIDAETLTHTTRYGLAELLDLPRDQDLEVTDQLDFYDLPNLEKESLLNQAFATRPEILSLQFAATDRPFVGGFGTRAAPSSIGVFRILAVPGLAFQQWHSGLHLRSVSAVSNFHRRTHLRRKKLAPNWKSSAWRKFAARWRRESWMK